MPSKHKEKNTIRFKPFSERVNSIDVDIIHHVGHRNEEQDLANTESHFYVALQKWNELNCSQGWKEFFREVNGVQSLAQLLLLKEQTVSSLLAYLKKTDPLTIQALLEMVIALARDLRKEFYPYYPDVLAEVTNLLSSKDAEVLEWSFQCLAYLFKFLWRCMVRTIKPALSSLLPLLSSKRPKYINYFAADSFAFLARKVKDQMSFLCLILNHLKNKPEDMDGCGRLMFAWMRGIKGQLHSSTQNLLLLLFRSLGSELVPSDVLESLLSHTLTHLTREIRPGGLTFLWEAIETTLARFSSDKDANWGAVPRVLKLACQLCQYNEAVHLISPTKFLDKLLLLFMKSTPLPESVISQIADIVAVLLVSPNVSIPQEQAVRLTTEVLTSSYTNVTFSFVKKLLHWGSLEVLILPRLLKLLSDLFHSDTISSSELSFLAQLIHSKAPPFLTASDFTNAKVFELDFTSNSDLNGFSSDTVCKKLLEPLRAVETSAVDLDPLHGLQEKIYSLIILPHVKPINRKEILKILKSHLLCVLKNIQHFSSAHDEQYGSTTTNVVASLLLLLTASIESVIRISGTGKGLEKLVDVDLVVHTLLPLTQKSPLALNSLRVLNIYLEAIDIQNLPNKVQLSAMIFSCLKLNLAAAHHSIREMTCRVFMQLSVEEEMKFMFSVFLESEMKEASVVQYREKLQLLKKLSYSSTHSYFVNSKDFEMMPLYLILGSLYINFQLLWEPLQELVASFAAGLPIPDFWAVFHSQLMLATSQCDCSSVDSGTTTSVSFECTLLNSYYCSLTDVDDKPDYPHYRLLLWQTMRKFPEVCENRNRDVASLVLSFIETEYYRSDAEVALSWNLKKDDVSLVDDHCAETAQNVNGDEEMDTDIEELDSDAEMRHNHSEKSMSEPTSRKIPLKKIRSEKMLFNRLIIKTLLAQLGLLSKMRNPRGIHRESDLSRIYHDFLSHKNENIQKTALECIMTYKHKYLMPYSQHLFALIDHKSYKTEMLSFCISKESDKILKEHRPQLIPIIIKIVYSKMTVKTGMRTGGKGSSALRRSTVLRFLAGCHEEEMLVFIEMAFRFYCNLLKDDPATMSRHIQSAIDLENVIPPRRLQSSVNLLSVIQDQFGGLMGNKLLGLILRLLVCVGSTVKGILDKRENVHARYHNSLRQLWNSCLDVLSQFFERFEAYPWNASEIDTVLDVFVWPLIERLPFEGVYSPTSLMKLLTVWSRHPRYFILFGAHSPTSKKITPLPALMSLLLSSKSPTVCNSVMEMLEYLLTLKDHEHFDMNGMELDDVCVEEMAPAIPVTHVLPLREDIHSKLNLSVTPNLGSKLVYPYIEEILEKLKLRLLATSKRGSGLTKRELLVLSAVSEFVQNPKTRSSLAELLIPLLSKRTAGNVEDEEPVLRMLNTLSHLLQHVDNPQLYFKSLAPLFGTISGVAARKMLVSLINILTESCSSSSGEENYGWNTLASVVSGLNAFDARWVEQPDFDQRLDAFKEVQKLSDAGSLSVELGVIVFYHCFYTIRSEKDMSLRDFAGHCLRNVAPKLCLKFKVDTVLSKYLIDSTLLALIHKSLSKTNSETLQSEAVLLLREMTIECSDLHPVLKDLFPLVNKSDPEVDFFENLQHLQLHRKTRALLKVCEVFSNLEKAPGPRTLTQFILPLAAQFLCSDKYAGKNSVVDAAINVIGVVCRLLPWHQYEVVLRYYLGRLRLGVQFQKQLVRIIVAILDSFHFDLSRAELSGLIKPKDSSKKVDDNFENNKTCDDPEPIEEDAEQLQNSEKESEMLENQEFSLDDFEAIGMETEEIEEMQPIGLAVHKQVVLCPSAATRAIRTVLITLLPQLHRTLIARTVLETTHKVNKKRIQNNYHDKDVEEEELLRVPMALAVVKLLQQLPEGMLNQNVPGIFAKLCMFLKSRLESVRKIARETLQKVMVSLGPSYLETMLHEMTSLLTRGFQVHVLVFCIHSVLLSLKESFRVGDIDGSIASIVDVCKNDLFGSLDEEREMGKISSKLREARSSKSYDTLHLISQFASENYLTNILVPFKEVMQTAHSHKVVSKANECLRHIILGFSENLFIPPVSMLVFAYGVASESIPRLSFKHEKKITNEQENILRARRRPDCFIIPDAPKHHIGIKSTDAAKVAARMNAHLIVDFGLRLIYALLRKEKFKEIEENVKPYLDPVISLVNECLLSQHVKLCTLSLQCLTLLFHIELPSLKNQISTITSSIFNLLHKFAAASLSKGDNFEVVVAGFKAVAVLVRDVKYHTLNEDQLKALLLYAEQDFADINKHATAFALLKAVLSRKLVVPEIRDVMDRIATLSISSDLSFVRQQARSVFYQYLMDYPLGDKLGKHLSFYLSQLNFELRSGRESALEMVNSIITAFPLPKLSEHCELFFLMLGARLINDDSPDCRIIVAQCLTKMLHRLEKTHRDHLYNMNMLWLRDKKVSHRQLAAQLCGLFVECEKKAFKGRLGELFPVIIVQFSSVVNAVGWKEDAQKHESEKAKDHHLYQVLQLILKICVHCPDWLDDPNLADCLSNVTEHISKLLAHPHEWVRLASAQILTHVLSALNADTFSKALQENTAIESKILVFFKTNTRSKIKSLILDHCAQLKAGVEVKQELLLQVVKNLVILADILKNVNNEEKDDVCLDSEGGRQSILSLPWLVRRMRKIFNAELTQAPRSTTMRTMVLNWTAAVVLKLGNNCIEPILHDLLAPVVRELSNDEKPQEGSPQAELHSLAKEVGNLLKKTVGVPLYLQTQSRLQLLLNTKRAERKKILKQEAVAEPEKAAKRKALKQARKKEAKRTRMSVVKRKKFKKRNEVCIDD